METICTTTEMDMEINWEQYCFGRCIISGNCYDKEDWRNERTMFEEKFGYDAWEEMYLVAINQQEHEGNGVCFDCAEEIMEEIEAKKKKKQQKRKIKFVIVDKFD